MRVWLLDTGPLVAYLDSGDPDHAAVADRLSGFTGRLVTTSAVVTEAMYFAREVDQGPRRLAEFLEASGTEVFDFATPADLLLAAALMERYPAVPMDYADATLLLLAEAVGVRDIATLDRRGFRTYRTRPGRALRLVLDE